MGLLAEDSEEVVDVIVDYFFDDHRLYLGTGWHAKCSHLGLHEQKDIHIVHMLLVDLVVIIVALAFRVGGSFGFRNFLVELAFRRVTLERPGGSRLVDIRRGMCGVGVQPCGDHLERRRISRMQKAFRTSSCLDEGEILTSTSLRGRRVRHQYYSMYDGLDSRCVLGRRTSVTQ